MSDPMTTTQAPEGGSGSSAEGADTHRGAVKVVVGDHRWIDWPGGENPVPGIKVRWRNKHGDEGEFLSDKIAGWNYGHRDQIVAYKFLQQAPISDDTQASGFAVDGGGHG